MSDHRIRDIFVIMPFNNTPNRTKEDLTAFFEFNLKAAIENYPNFQYKYRVSRSDDSFDIHKKIVCDIYNADIVLCDLSGEYANPNVMYELGLRLALTNKPVIMFRQQLSDNKQIFDISVYHTKPYAITRYRELEDYIIGKIEKFESGEEIFSSPVLAILAKESSVIEDLQRQKAINVTEAMIHSLTGLMRGTGGAVHHFLKASSLKLRPPEGASDLIKFIQDNQKELKSLDWKTLSFHPTLPPSLHMYLSEFPFNGAVDDHISRLWNSILTEYFTRFFATDLYWSFIDYSSVHQFIGETHALRNALIDLLGYMQKSHEDEKKKELDDMWESLSQSSLIDQSTK